MNKATSTALAGLLAIGLVAAACGDDDTSSPAATSATEGTNAGGSDVTSAPAETDAAGTSAGSAPSSQAATTEGTAATTDTAGGGGGSALDQAIAATAIAKEGTNREVDSTSRPAATDKHVVIISAAQSQLSSSVPVGGAEEAAKALGWQVDIYDAEGNPGNFSPLVRQAIASGADAIVADAIDCQAAKQAFQEAKDAGIVTVPIYAFDCNDPRAGNEPEGLFTTAVNFGEAAAEGIGAFTESYGADQANYIIADSDDSAKIIVLQDSEFVVLLYTYEGFKNQIEASEGSEIVETIDFTVADLIAGKVPAMVQAALLQHPDATWIKSPYTAATLGGVVPGLGAQSGSDIKVMGGEGFEQELDLLREGQINALNIISSEWVGWASIDAINSVFNGEDTVDSGVGWTIVDAEDNLPESGPYVPPTDFKAQFQEAWGVG